MADLKFLMGKEKLKAGKMRLPTPKDDAKNGIATVAGQIYFAEDANGKGFARIYYDNADGKRLQVNSFVDPSNNKIDEFYVTFPTLSIDYSKGIYSLEFKDGQGSSQNKTYTLSDIYPSAWTWSPGTAAGPTAAITLLRNGNAYGSISVGAIPSASATASGIVTNGPQTFAGEKTFNNKLIAGTSSSSGLALDVRGNANIAFQLSFSEKAHIEYDNSDECLYFTF